VKILIQIPLQRTGIFPSLEKISTSTIPNAHHMKIYFMMLLTILIRNINIDTFFDIVGQTLKSLTSTENYATYFGIEGVLL
jgi:hypothetical protein